MRSNAKLPKIISKRIKKRRNDLGMTQEDLAEKVGVSRVYIGYVEQGRNTPSLEISLVLSIPALVYIRKYTK